MIIVDCFRFVFKPWLIGVRVSSAINPTFWSTKAMPATRGSLLVFLDLMIVLLFPCFVLIEYQFYGSRFISCIHPTRQSSRTAHCLSKETGSSYHPQDSILYLLYRHAITFVITIQFPRCGYLFFSQEVYHFGDRSLISVPFRFFQTVNRDLLAI